MGKLCVCVCVTISNKQVLMQIYRLSNYDFFFLFILLDCRFRPKPCFYSSTSVDTLSDTPGIITKLTTKTRPWSRRRSFYCLGLGTYSNQFQWISDFQGYSLSAEPCVIFKDIISGCSGDEESPLLLRAASDCDLHSPYSRVLCTQDSC